MGGHQVKVTGDALDLAPVRGDGDAPATVRNTEDASAHLFWYGRRSIENPKDLGVGWRAVRAVAAGNGTVTVALRFALVGKMCATGVPQSIIEAVMAWECDGTPADLIASAASSQDARARMSVWVLYEGISASFADGVVSLGEVERLTRMAATMGIARGVVDELIEVCCEEALLRERRIAALSAAVDTAGVHGVRGETPTIPALEYLPVPEIPGELPAITRPWRR